MKKGEIESGLKGITAPPPFGSEAWSLADLRAAFRPCVFFEKGHRYKMDGKWLRSVSSVVKEYAQPFDSDYWSAYSAAKLFFGRVWPLKEERLIGTPRGSFTVREIGELGLRPSPADLREEWKEAGRQAADHGTAVHAFSEAYAIGKIVQPVHRGLHAFFQLPEQAILQPVALELIVACAESGVAGQLDAILYDPQSGQHILRDFKTNKELKTDNPYGNMLPPFDHLPDCNFNHYVLQLNLYRTLLGRKGFEVDRMEIIHVPSTDAHAPRQVEVPWMDVESCLRA